jgi:type I restriction enzyme S subunit
LSAIADSHTSAYPSFNPDVLENSLIPYPDEVEQEAIAKTLSDLDDKIELNEKMNKTLEAIGTAIFRHWFIDFEFPNEEGKPFKSSGGDMIFDEEIGKKIPKGWKTGTMGEIAEQLRDQVLPYQHPERIYRHLSIEAFDSGMQPVVQPGSKILSSKFVVQNGTVLISKLNPRIQRVWPVIDIGENSVCSTEFLVFKPKGGFFSYFYNLALWSRIKNGLVQMARGTSSSHQRISAEDVRNILILIPSKVVLQLFENTILPILVDREQNVSGQIILAQVRDLILPRIMSGKMRVPVEVR